MRFATRRFLYLLTESISVLQRLLQVGRYRLQHIGVIWTSPLKSEGDGEPLTTKSNCQVITASTGQFAQNEAYRFHRFERTLAPADKLPLFFFSTE